MCKPRERIETNLLLTKYSLPWTNSKKSPVLTILNALGLVLDLSHHDHTTQRTLNPAHLSRDHVTLSRHRSSLTISVLCSVFLPRCPTQKGSLRVTLPCITVTMGTMLTANVLSFCRN